MQDRKPGTELPKSLAFARTHRLTTKAQFDAVYNAKARRVFGPLVISSLPNNAGHPRLGISMAKRVGTAPQRNHIKRMLRESFRMMQHEFPRGYDLLISVRPHEAMSLAEYKQILRDAVAGLHATWEKRRT